MLCFAYPEQRSAKVTFGRHSRQAGVLVATDDLRKALDDWIASLPPWQQYALSLLADSAELSAQETGEVCTALLAHHGLAEWNSGFEGYTPSPPSSASVKPEQRVLLKEVQCVEGINALAPDEVLPFGKELTVIYGPNASGKSGYARMLAAACQAVGAPRQVLPNVYETTPGAQRAKIVLNSPSSPEQELMWEPGADLPEMTRFAFFDDVATQHYLSRPTSMKIGPTALECFDTLASFMTGPLQHELEGRITGREPREDLAARFSEGTQTKRLLEAPTQPTALTQLEALCKLSSEEEAELAATRGEIAALTAPDRAARAKQLRTQLTALNTLADGLSGLHASLSSDVVQELTGAIATLSQAATAAQRAGAQQFATDNLTAIGTPEWRAFVRAANGLADAEASVRGRSYPDTDDICLLCHQPLSHDAVELIRRYALYLQADAEQTLANAQEAVTRLRGKLSALQFDQLDPDRVSTAALVATAPGSVPELQDHVRALEARRDALLALFDGAALDTVGPVADLPREALDTAVAAITKQVSALEPPDLQQKLETLRVRERELSDRQLLRDMRTQAEAFIKSKQWVAKARAIRLDTAPITRKHTELYNLSVTEAYKRYFRNECDRLGLRAPVAATFIGSRGQSQRKLELDAAQSCALEHVLSEGEQRVAALADFLTEVGQTPGMAGIVLDDPVCSLDHAFRGKVAQRLCEEAQFRQVIVFTHSLEFMSSLHTRAEKLYVPCTCHWLEKTEAGAGIVSLNDGPPPEKKYKSTEIARQAYKRAKEATGSERLRAVQDGFGALRTTCEYFIIHVLLGGVVQRFAEEIKVRNIEQIVLDPEIAAEVIEFHGDTSGYIKGHLHSDTGPADIPPTPEDLYKYIEDFEAISTKYKNLVRAAGK